MGHLDRQRRLCTKPLVVTRSGKCRIVTEIDKVLYDIPATIELAGMVTCITIEFANSETQSFTCYEDVDPDKREWMETGKGATEFAQKIGGIIDVEIEKYEKKFNLLKYSKN